MNTFSERVALRLCEEITGVRLGFSNQVLQMYPNLLDVAKSELPRYYPSLRTVELASWNDEVEVNNSGVWERAAFKYDEELDSMRRTLEKAITGTNTPPPPAQVYVDYQLQKSPSSLTNTDIDRMSWSSRESNTFDGSREISGVWTLGDFDPILNAYGHGVQIYGDKVEGWDGKKKTVYTVVIRSGPYGETYDERTLPEGTSIHDAKATAKELAKQVIAGSSWLTP